MLKNTSESYGLIARSLHWTVSVLIITLLCVGYYMTNTNDFSVIGTHKAVGVLVLSLMIFRIIWRYKNIVPSLPTTVPHWQASAAFINTQALYLLAILMPLSGMTMSLYGGRDISFFELFTIKAFEKNPKLATLANEMHSAFAIILIISLALHVLAALYHHFIKKDNVLKRMLIG